MCDRTTGSNFLIAGISNVFPIITPSSPLIDKSVLSSLNVLNKSLAKTGMAVNKQIRSQQEQNESPEWIDSATVMNLYMTDPQRLIKIRKSLQQQINKYST